MTSISIFNGFLPFVSDFRTAISALCFLVKIKPACLYYLPVKQAYAKVWIAPEQNPIKDYPKQQQFSSL